MPIYVAASLLPRNGGTWSLIEDKYLRGGFQVAATQAIRDAIDSMNRKTGMLVLTLDDGKLYSLQPNLTTWLEFTVAPTAHTHAIANITTDSNNQFVSDAEKTTWTAKQDALGYTPVDAALVGVNSGVASLDVSGKLSAAQIPDITITDTYVVASEVAQLAITCQVGDVAVRTDLSKSFILKTAGASVLANWQELLSPTTGVVTVGVSAPIQNYGSAGSPVIGISAATTSAEGSMSAADKSKLDGIAANANNYVHPTVDGSLHVPATSTVNNGKVLTAGATAGSLSWTTPTTGTVTGVTATGPVVSSGGNAPVISMPAATSVVNGYMTSVYAAKLDGIAAGATANLGTVTSVGATSPVVSTGGTTPSISMSPATASVDGYMTSVYASKLDGIAASANNYVHPTGDGNLHVPATSTTNSGKVLTAGATAGSLSWTTAAGGTITSVTATSPVTSSGGNAPVIAMPAATSAIDGYLKSTDWVLFNSKGAGNVLTVSATAPVVSSGGTTPSISMSPATSSVNGYMTSVYAAKLDGIAAGATAYAHPTGDGNLHVPATSTTNNGKVLTAGATAGSLSWVTPSVGGTVNSVTATGPVVSSGGTDPVVSMPAATSAIDGYLKAVDWVLFNSKGAGNVLTVSGTAPVVSSGGTSPTISMSAASAGVNGYMSGAYATKLDGIATGATANVGTVTGVSGTAPIFSTGGTTPAISMTTATSIADGYMTSVYASKLDGIAASANNYAHPTGDGNLHVPATSTTNNGKVLTAGATAGSLSWVTPTVGGTVTGVTANAPVTSTGGTAPVIAMAAATSSIDGYLKAVDWVLFNSKGPGSVTSVGGTGSINGLTLSGTVTTSGSLTLGGSVTSVATTGNFQMNSLGVGTAAAGTAGDIRATGDVTAFYSDARLKNVSGNIPDALAKVLALNGVVYTNNDTAKSFGYMSDAEQVGVLAQDVELVLPQVVTAAPFDIGRDEVTGNEFSKSGQDYMTVRYERLVPLLIEAIKELTAKVAVLEGR